MTDRVKPALHRWWVLARPQHGWSNHRVQSSPCGIAEQSLVHVDRASPAASTHGNQGQEENSHSPCSDLTAWNAASTSSSSWIWKAVKTGHGRATVLDCQGSRESDSPVAWLPSNGMRTPQGELICL